jgi:hypothetical protein
VFRSYIITFASLVLLPRPCLAQQQGAAQPQGSPRADQLLRDAEQKYEALEYEQSLQAAVQVHKVQGVAPMQRAYAFLYMAVNFTALGQAEEAVKSFMGLLQIKPDFRIPDTVSPSIKAMFAEALKRLKLPEKPPPGAAAAAPGGAQVPVQVEARAPESVQAGRPVDVEIKVTDPGNNVQALQIRWRVVGGPDFSTVKVTYKPGTARVTGRIPGATVSREQGKLLFFVEALGRGEMTLAHAGSMDDPLVVALTLPRKKKSNAGWWVLGVGGALVVAGGIVAAVLLTRGDGGPAPLPDNVDVTVVLK